MLYMLIDKFPGGLMKHKGWGNQKKKIAWTWFSRSHQACRRGNKSNKQLIIFKRGTAWVHQASYKVYSVKARKLKNYYIKADEKNEMKVEQTETVTSTKCKSCDGNHNLHHCQFYHEIAVDDRNIFLKKNRLCYSCYTENSPKHTARSCINRRICKVCQGKSDMITLLEDKEQ